MIKFILLFTLITTSTFGQDSLFVHQTCQKIQGLSNKKDAAAQLDIIYDQSINNLPEISKTSREKIMQDHYRFQYRLNRELKRTCPGFIIDRVPIKAQKVIDLENRFSKKEIDSLKAIIDEIQKEKKIYIYVVTIDDYFPDKTLEQFSSRNREYWANEYSFEKGTVMMAFSFRNQQFRISTGFTSSNYLSDKQCQQAVEVITSFFKRGEYFSGVVMGLNNLKEKI